MLLLWKGYCRWKTLQRYDERLPLLFSPCSFSLEFWAVSLWYDCLIQEQIWCLEPFQDGIWVSSSDYRNASPDPLRHFAEKIVNEINLNNMEDVYRFCNIYVDLDFQVCSQQDFWQFCCYILFLFFFSLATAVLKLERLWKPCILLVIIIEKYTIDLYAWERHKFVRGVCTLMNQTFCSDLK